MSKKVGIDIDGCLADFNNTFIPLIKQVTKRDLFPKGVKADDTFPTDWDYPQLLGYSNEEVAKVWEAVRADRYFWFNLKPLEGAKAVSEALWGRLLECDRYFISDRSGEAAKAQSEMWLETHGIDYPTVLLSKHKGTLCRVLEIDCYIDDKLENIESVQNLGWTRAYLLDKPYNREGRFKAIKVVKSVQEFLDIEELTNEKAVPRQESLQTAVRPAQG